MVALSYGWEDSGAIGGFEAAEFHSWDGARWKWGHPPELHHTGPTPWPTRP